MHIIYLHQYFKFPTESGGTRSYDLAISFLKAGHEATVVTATSDEKYNTNLRWIKEVKEGLVIHYIYMPYGNHLSYLQRTFIFFKFLWFSSFRILKIKCDVVLATSTPLTIGIPALIKKWFGKTPFVFEVRDVWPEAVIAIGAIKNKLMQKVLFKLEELMYSNASYIVPLSTDMQKSILARFPQYHNKAAVVIENIAEINRFQSEKAKVNLEEVIGFIPRFSVLYAGTFGKVNGIHKFIELAEKTLLLDDKVVFILIGGGKERESIEKLALEKQVLNKNFFILNPVKKNDLPMWYNTVSMGSSFVIDVPELWANSANKFFDTLAAGKPILINHEGWQAETIRSGNCGYILPAEVTELDAKRFVDYTLNIDLIKEQEKYALELAIEKFSLEKAGQKYLNLFNLINKNNV